MCKKLEKRELELLKASLESQRFYHAYKKTSLPLTSAWRMVQRLADAGLVEYKRGNIEVTEAGLAVLASHGDPTALAILARKYGVAASAVEEYLAFLCSKVNDLPVKTLADTVGLIGPSSLRGLRGTRAEELAAKLLLKFCEDCAIEINGSKFILGKGGIIAAQCNLCGGVRFELYPECHRIKIFPNIWKYDF